MDDDRSPARRRPPLEPLQRFLVFWGLNTLMIWVASELTAGVAVAGPGALLLAGLAFGLVNALLKPVLIVLTLPITVVSLGLFLLVINTGILFLVGWMVPGLTIGTFWQAMGAAVLISVLGFVLNLLLRR